MYIAFIIALVLTIPFYYLLRQDIYSKTTPFDDQADIVTYQSTEGDIYTKVIIEDIYTGYVKKVLIGISSSSSLQFNLSNERWYEKLLKKIGLITEYQTGDAIFDKKVYIASDVGLLHELLNESMPLREKIVEILSLNLIRKQKSMSIKNRHNMIWLEINCKPTIKPKKFKIDEIIVKVKSLLHSIRDDIAQKKEIKTVNENIFNKSVFIEHISIVLLAMSFGLGISMTYVIWPSIVISSDLYPYLFSISLIFVIIVMITLVKRYFQSSWTHKTIARYFFALYLSSLLPVYMLLKLINVSFDTTKSTYKEFHVVDRHITTKITKYYLHVKSWKKENSTITVRVPEEMYDSKKIRLALHQGFLNVEWISNIESLKKQ